MNNEITVLLRSSDAIVHNGEYTFSAAGISYKLAGINCLQVALSSLTIPNDFVLKWCPRLEFSYSLIKSLDIMWNVDIPPFHYLTANDIIKEISKHVLDDHVANISFAYDPFEYKFTLWYNRLRSFEMGKDTEKFFQFDVRTIQLGAHKKSFSIYSLRRAPYNKPLPVFVECDIVEGSSVGSRIRPILSHLCYDMDYTDVTLHCPRPLTWLNCAYRPQGDTITITLRQDSGFNITINKDDTPEVICELKFRNRYIS